MTHTNGVRGIADYMNTSRNTFVTHPDHSEVCHVNVP